MNARQVLRAFILQRIKNWSLRELRERIADGLTLRLFTMFFSNKVPQHNAFNRNFNKLSSDTVRLINESVIAGAVELKIEDGKKSRVDSTVSETDIHYPTDASLLSDSVRVITRLVGRLGEMFPNLSQGFVNHTRRAKRRTRELDKIGSSGRKRSFRRKYRELVRTTQKVVDKARQVVQNSKNVGPLSLEQADAVERLCSELHQYCEIAEQVIQQTSRRVFQGEEVPVQNKIFSIFETHTDLIKRGKVRKPIEFGHKIFFAESGNGLVTDYQILDGNPSDTGQVARSLEHHKKMFGTVPELYAGDRGFYSPEALQACRDAGVKTECVPQRGGKRTPEREAYEKSPQFKKGQRFRSGIEGRISVLIRGRGMNRCCSEGRERFEAFIGAVVLANNLLNIARVLHKKRIRLGGTG
jgi:IS5 family transposase